MIDLARNGFNPDETRRALQALGITERCEQHSAFEPIFKRMRIWDALHVDEIVRAFALDPQHHAAIQSRIDAAGLARASFIDLLTPPAPAPIQPVRDVLFPGLATNEEVFSGISYRRSNCLTIDYRKIDFTQSMDVVIEEVIERNGLTPQDRLIATSFGGILAARIAKLFGSDHLHLVGAIINPGEIGYLRGLGLRGRLFKLFSIDMIPPGLISFFFGVKSKECELVILRMMDTYPRWKIKEMLSFLASTMEITFTWRKRIHGDHDLVVCKPAKPFDSVPGGHVISMKENLDPIRIRLINRLLLGEEAGLLQGESG